MIAGMDFSLSELTELLTQKDANHLYSQADHMREQSVGSVVHIRAILEFSNICRRSCGYCGLNCTNTQCERYRMTPDEIIASAQLAAQAGYKTLVMQSGEDAWFTPERLSDIVRDIVKTGISVTISCGEMPDEGYALIKQAGAARYLLKHETADPKLYAALHPDSTLDARIRCLRTIKRLGFETGGGFMIGLPGQTPEIIAQDLLLLRDLECDMAGIGPFIAHPDTPLGGNVSGSADTTKRAVALARLLLPHCNLPATTSLGVVDLTEKNSVFSCGANVIMHKVTPDRYKEKYSIYPASFAPTDVFADRAALEQKIKELNRIPV